MTDKERIKELEDEVSRLKTLLLEEELLSLPCSENQTDYLNVRVDSWDSTIPAAIELEMKLAEEHEPIMYLSRKSVEELVQFLNNFLTRTNT